MALTGKNASFKIDDSGGILRDLSTDVNSVSLPASMDAVDSTTFQATDGAKTYIPGLQDHTISIEGVFDTTALTGSDTVLSGLIGFASTASFEFAPDAAGGAKYEGECICTGYEISAPVADLVSFSASLQVSGAVTRTTF